MKAYYYSQDKDEAPVEKEIPDDLKDQAADYHQRLLEALAEYDEEFMMQVLDGQEPSVEDIKRVARKAVLTAEFFQSSAEPPSRTKASSSFSTLSSTTSHPHLISQVKREPKVARNTFAKPLTMPHLLA